MSHSFQWDYKTSHIKMKVTAVKPSHPLLLKNIPKKNQNSIFINPLQYIHTVAQNFLTDLQVASQSQEKKYINNLFIQCMPAHGTIIIGLSLCFLSLGL